MSAEHRYGDALDRMDGTARVGLKAAVEALADGDDEIAAEMLHAVARILERGGTDE